MNSKKVIALLLMCISVGLLLAGCGSTDVQPAPQPPKVAATIDIAANLAAHNSTTVPWSIAPANSRATRASCDIVMVERFLTGNKFLLTNAGAGATTAAGTGRLWVIDSLDNTILPVGAGGDYFIKGFLGKTAGGAGGQANNGPNGLTFAQGFTAAGAFFREAWVGDGNGTVQVVDMKSESGPYTITSTIATGGAYRADELAYDPLHDIVVIGVDQEDGTGGSTLTNATLVFMDRAAKTIFPTGKVTYDGHANTAGATLTNWPLVTFASGGGMEQPAWDAPYFYQSVPLTITTAGATGNAGGEIDVIDPAPLRAGLAPTLIARYALTGCAPAGLAVGPSHKLIVGCGDTATGGAKVIILDGQTGTVLKTITQVGGADEVYYNFGNNRFYVAASNCPAANASCAAAWAPLGGCPAGGTCPVIGEIDAATNTWLRDIPTTPGAHSVAADPDNGNVLVPMPNGVGVTAFAP